MKRKINKNVINVAIVAIMFIALLYYILVVEGWSNIVIVMRSIKPIWFLVAGGLIISYWFLESIVLHIVTLKVCKKERFVNSFRVSMIGQLFRNITPFSSGGQPMQAVAMVNSGISISNSATILLIKFIIYQSVLVIYTSIILLFKFQYFSKLVSGFITLSIIGFTMNLVVIISLILIGVNKKFVHGVLKVIYKFLHKLRIVKHSEERLEKINNSIDNFHEQFKIIKKEKALIIKSALITFIQLTVESTITYAVYRAFGHSAYGLINMISAQTFLYMIMAFVPTPGAGGAAEGGFYIIFKTFFNSNEISMAILSWRLFTFYLPIIVGSLFLFFKPHKKENRSNFNIENT